MNKELLQQALDAIRNSTPTPLVTDCEYADGAWQLRREAVKNLEAALAQPANRTWSWDKAQDTYVMDPPEVSAQPAQFSGLNLSDYQCGDCKVRLFCGYECHVCGSSDAEDLDTLFITQPVPPAGGS